ncbi:hypothetical protein [Nocardia sp. NRRL WC-3656]|uniref:hypothetical protein n=1 Tax=Nocardia sp. NRRL WC-3656 TaxID=1463824 RepID=UPI0004C35725|nr:hypothetical protein [Nocardia sp. NRRL WC-3656]
MAGLILTDERRTELASLLDNEARLRAEYPLVADYLDTAPRLPGTGDDSADAAFDLRLVNYMTGGHSPTGNPYWDIVGPSVTEQSGRRVVNGGRQAGSARLGYAQTVLQAAYAYAVPAPETLQWVKDFAQGAPVLELGAGRGYWAAQLDRIGVNISAFDVEPPGQSENPSFPRAAGQRDTWHPVMGLDDFEACSKAGAVLFLCWPPGWGNTMASDATEAFERAGGDRLVFIGEPKGGKTGDDAFFERLEQGWRPESTGDHVSWWNLADVAQGWVRR